MGSVFNTRHWTGGPQFPVLVEMGVLGWCPSGMGVLVWVVILVTLIHPGVTLTENRNIHLRIGSIESEPFLRSVPGEEGNAGYEGFIKDLVEDICKKQGFSYTFVLSRDNKYGVDTGGGNWSGLVGMLINGDIDMIAADLTVTWSRMSVMDFSKPFLYSSLTLLLKDPDSYEFDLSSWFQPFSLEVWLLLGAAYVLSSLVLWLAARFSPFENTSNSSRLLLKDSFWYLISSWFRGSPFHPRAWSTRLLACAWWMFYITAIITYFLHLPPHLVTPTASTTTRPDTVQTVLDREMQFGVVRGGSTYQLLKNSANPLHKKLWDSISTNFSSSLLSGYDAGLQRVNIENGDFSMVMESTAAQYLTARDCSLYTVGSLEDRHYAFGFPEGSKLRRKFSHGLLNMTETGKLSAAKLKFWPEPVDCPQVTAPPQAAQRTTLTIDHLAPPLLFLLVAIILSLFLSVLEMCTSKNISSLPKYLGQSFYYSPSGAASTYFHKYHPSKATQTVLWASSRATTPGPGGPASPPPLHHRIYTQDGKLVNA